MLYLEINLAAVRNNIQFIRSKVNAQLNAVIKANCYGLGIALAKHIEPLVDSFSVSSSCEGLEARRAGLGKKIYNLGAIDRSNFELVHNMVYTVCSCEDVSLLEATERQIRVAIKINTGMNRLGVFPSDFEEVYLRVIKSKTLALDSVYTHLFNALSDSAKNQLGILSKLSDGLGVFRHCCASNCLYLESSFHLDMVRCGLSIYGYGNPSLQPSLRVYSDICQINHVRAGEHIGYGSFVAKEDCTVGIIRVGYADGYRRSEKLQYASFKGEPARILGVISMDMMAVDISGKNAKIGDRVYLIDDIITVDSIAESNGTIPYEVLTAFNSSRSKRIYVN